MNLTQKLNELTEQLKKSYETISVDVNKDTYFIMENGVVFQLLYLPPFNCFTISYADNLENANRDFFEEGDQFDADADIEYLISEINKELKAEAA